MSICFCLVLEELRHRRSEIVVRWARDLIRFIIRQNEREGQYDQDRAVLVYRKFAARRRYGPRCCQKARERAEVADIDRQTALAAGKEPQVVMMRDAWVDYTLEDAARVYVLEVMDASGFTSKIVPMPSTNSVG